MRISDATLEKLLQKAGKLKAAELDKLRAEEKRSNKPLQDLVIKNEIINDKELTQLYAKEIGIPFVELEPKSITKKTISLVPERASPGPIAARLTLHGSSALRNGNGLLRLGCCCRIVARRLGIRCPAQRHDMAVCPICSWAASKARMAAEAKAQRVAAAARKAARVTP